MHKHNKFLIVGGSGREAIIATRLMEDSSVYAFISHANPTISNCVEQSSGQYTIGDTSDAKAIAEFARQHHIDYAFVSADDPLANGVVDELLKHDIKAVGGTQAATRIEWDKIYAIELMAEVCPEFTPFYKIVAHQHELAVAIQEFTKRGIEVVVKPQGLTGGKGVKVMPEHLASYQDCYQYAEQLLKDRPSERVLLTEKLYGPEFTIMGFTDGEHLVMAPASYDYPFRFEGDKGAGTGGMGCFTDSRMLLPFMTEQDWQDCRQIMTRIITKMRQEGLHFNGVLNGGFFKTKDGIGFMEFNARFGDPEALNVLSVLDGSLAELLIAIYHKQLAEHQVRFSSEASVSKYLVAKEYPDASPDKIDFFLDKNAIKSMGVSTYFASCIKAEEDEEEHQYQTLKKSRVVALVAKANQVADASKFINQAIDKHVIGDLEYRHDIGCQQYLDRLNQ